MSQEQLMEAAWYEQKGAATPVWLATLPEDGATGGYFDEYRQPMPW